MKDAINGANISESKDNLGVTAQSMKAEISKHLTENNKQSDLLKHLLLVSEKIKETISSKIVEAKPILNHGDLPIIFPSTINVIQGQTGAHKSRLAEVFCSAILKRSGTKIETLGIERTALMKDHIVLYVDTERNLKDQFPMAIQNIQINAGYTPQEDVGNFKYISLIHVSRKDRFNILTEYLAHLRTLSQQPLFIVFDTITDCVDDFNNTDSTMKLIDLLNETINNYNVSFLCVIHENPRSDKARGHLGTELINKSSTALQVNFVKDAQKRDTDIVRIKFLKFRSTKNREPFYAKYCDIKSGLQLVSQDEFSTTAVSRKQKADFVTINDFLVQELCEIESISRKQLLDKMSAAMDTATRTLETRLKEIIEEKKQITAEDGQSYILTKKSEGKTTNYLLQKIE